MEVELLTLSGVKFKGTASMVSLVAADGEMGILPHHEPYTARLVPGPVTVHTKGKKQVFALYGGLLEITADRVRLLADEADHEDDIVAAEVEQALKRAQDMKARAKDKHELARAQHLVDRESVRLNVAKMRRGKAPTKP
ncbi:MAG TPA: ATP synthase F1 subunit epsilon [Candidatus Saccharimonadia bacterium]|nr:ATP synthase F1 subunit epsilon [Candidatus Saccharimonadia bacterium]